jgi:transcriptional regulator with XRE-family HTH domain
METLGTRLKAERKRLRHSLEEFAAVGGVGRSTQANYEAGTTRPTADYLNKISTLGAEIFWITRGTEEDDEYRNKAPAPYAPDVMRLITLYEACNDKVKKSVLNLLESQQP